MNSSVLAIDIGGGTQDILLYDPDNPLENSVKLVLPSPTVIAARRINEISLKKKTLHLKGKVMGGGAVSRAVRKHLEAGLKVVSQESPALTMHDNLDKVRSMGVIIDNDYHPDDAEEVILGDLDLESLRRALDLYEVKLPEYTALAIQDHGFSPNASNRLTRFRQWQNFLDAGGDIGDLLFNEPPAGLSRWAAAVESAPNAFIMDTSSAALRGAMLDDFAARFVPEGLVVINAGNEHTVAFLVRDRRVWGIYEHHTGLLDNNKLMDQMKRFSLGELSNEEVFEQWGHGVAYQPGYRELAPFEEIVITGPQRKIARGLGHMAAPFGEMMLSGCFGLIEAVNERSKKHESR